jgi:hypothetical protein
LGRDGAAEEDSSEESAAAAWCRGGKGRVKQLGRSGSVKLCSKARFVGEKEREREITQPVQNSGGAGGSNRAAWRPLGTSARRGGTRGGQRGQRGRREEEQRDAWSKVQRGADQQGGAQDLAGAAACSRGRNREKPGFGEDEGDLVVKSRKHRGLTIKYR